MFSHRLTFLFLIFVCCFACYPAFATAEPAYKSPAELAISPDGALLYVTNRTAGSLSVIDTAGKKVLSEIAVGQSPNGVVVSPDGKTVFVANTRSHNVGFVDVQDPKNLRVVAEVACGYEPWGLCISPDGKTLYAANFISDDVSVIDVATRKETARIQVDRAPKYLAVTPDGKTLLVHNFFATGPATDPNLSWRISVIDTASRKVVDHRTSPGTMVMGRAITVSPDGKFAFTVHHRPNFNVTTSQLMQGWIQTNALSIVPLDDPEGKVITVLLDNVNSGAANPYGVALSQDGTALYVTHRGIHKLSVIDLPKLRAWFAQAPPEAKANSHVHLGFLWGRKGLIRRIDSGGIGPQGIVVSPVDGTIYVANRFSDNVATIDPKTLEVTNTIPLGPPQEITQERRGEMLFHDARQCFQNWLSCTSCHPGIRADGLNWDLLNDGITNPKNVKSLFGAHETPPSMALGVRARMEVAVQKGFLFIQFHTPQQEQIDAVSAYLRSLPYLKSPWHRKPDGSLDELASKGQKVFAKAECNMCHPGPLFTDLRMYSVGTQGKRDFKEHKKFDVPSLRELYRTAPYLHDGGAATLREVVTTHNRSDKHGVTSNLTPEEIDALIAYLKAL